MISGKGYNTLADCRGSDSPANAATSEQSEVPSMRRPSNETPHKSPFNPPRNPPAAKPTFIRLPWVSAHAHDDHTVEGGIGLSVAAAVEPVAADLAAGGRDRA